MAEHEDGTAHPTRTLSLGVLAHIDAGKTSTTERILFEAGVIAEPGKVDDGTTVTDTMEQERRRGITIQAAVTAFTHEGRAVSLVDTPGHPDFIAEIERVLDILDGAVLVISAVEGVQAQTRILYRALKRKGLPFVIFVNKIDRVGARSEQLITEIRSRLTPNVVRLGEPVGLGARAARYEPYAAFPEAVRQDMIEVLAENDEEVLDLFVEHESGIDDEVLRSSAIREAHRGAVHPLLFGSAISGAGVPALMDAIVTYLPASAAPVDGDLAGRVFKIDRGPAGEKVCYAKVASGTLRSRQRVPVAGLDQRVTALQLFDEGAAVPVGAVPAGRIAKVWGFEKARIGDEIGGDGAVTRASYFARPFLESAARSKDPQNRGKLFQSLAQLAEQDPLIGLRQDDRAQTMYVSLYGEVQKEVIQETLATEFQVEADFSPSTIVHVERVTGVGKALDEAPDPFIATIGLRVEAGPVGSGPVFALEINTGSLPASFYKAVEAAAMRTLMEGLYGWEVVDCVVTMTQGILHRDWANSTAADHRKLAPLTVMDALRRAGTEVQEPIQSFHFECSADALGSFARVMPEFGEITSEPLVKAGVCVVEGTVRAAKVPDLRALIPGMTRGEGFLETEFSHFARVPGKFPTRFRTDLNPLDRGDYLRQIT
ncbi:MAG: TetM/TetW/TetO/TetS family tetracycline resistance ribosomal protection protein [Chloroflexi bacterium]|nr:TetM/TetW/TetO/TetS family tetracycline resistance ribosomal protection protein [Chloroflexota bacterium]